MGVCSVSLGTVFSTILANYRCKNFEEWHTNMYIKKSPFKNPIGINILHVINQIACIPAFTVGLSPIILMKVLKKCFKNKEKYKIEKPNDIDKEPTSLMR